jgi:hypothetical protein
LPTRADIGFPCAAPTVASWAAEVMKWLGGRPVPEIARTCLTALGAQLGMLKEQILEFDRITTPGIDPTRRASGSGDQAVHVGATVR